MHMEKKTANHEYEVFDKMRHLITEKLKLVFTYEMPMAPRRGYVPDIIITKDNTRIAVVEVKHDLRNYDKNIDPILRQVANANGFICAIITDGDNFLLSRTSKSYSENFEEFDINDLPKLLEETNFSDQIDELERLKPHLADFSNAVKVAADTKLHDDDTDTFKRKENILRFLERCKETDLIVKGGKLQFFDVKKENEFFEQLIEPYTADTVYRYTSHDSVFRTLESGQQSMCCLIGMNDKSEVNYVDKYLNPSVLTTSYDKKKENNYFILSCVEDTNDENLTMWRFYGDNTRGIRLTYMPQPMPDGFRLAKIYYGDKINHHAGLEFLKELLKIPIGKVMFQFNHIDYWKHYFKPFDYSIEKEVRLLYEKCSSNLPNQIKWIKVEEFSVTIPLALFNVKGFPLKIRELRLGPNMKEIETNELQLKQLCAERNILTETDAENNISASRIDSYRI